MQVLSKERAKALRTIAKINMLLSGDVPAIRLPKHNLIAAETKNGYIRLYDHSGNSVRVSA